ncbi:MAG: hypothetical protein LC795_14290 [Acidobacteria bacterium]|nr:hypothetical protein [Acidobacteriota bacterium]
MTDQKDQEKTPVAVRTQLQRRHDAPLHGSAQQLCEDGRRAAHDPARRAEQQSIAPIRPVPDRLEWLSVNEPDQHE